MDKICDKKMSLGEMSHIRMTFQNNGYPTRFITQALKHRPAATDPNKEIPETTKILCLLYLRGLSEPIQRICQCIGVKAVFKAQGTLRQALVRVKTPTPELMKKNVVYKVPCMDCEKVYVGETSRNLKRRLTEHKGAACQT